MYTAGFRPVNHGSSKSRQTFRSVILALLTDVLSPAVSRPFELQSDYAPAGDQPAAIEQLIAGVQSGLASQILLGVTGSGKTFTMANVVQALQRPTIVMAHNKTLAAQLYGEFKEFFPNNAVEYFVSYYDYYQPEAYVPSSDTYIEKDAQVNDHIEQMRLSATKALLERQDCLVVSTVSSIYGLGDPESYFKMVMHLSEARSSTNAAFCGSWLNCSTPATTSISSAAPTASAVT